MAEKDADDNTYSFENANKPDAAQALPEEERFLDTLLDEKSKKEESESLDLNSYLPSHESSLRKEENPFSFKKFLSQDLSAQKNKGARKKVYTSPSVSATSKLDLPNHSLNNCHMDMKSRVINASDVSSVLPDFVQDHLVIEQCYLSSSSPAIDIDNLNLQNLPDLNLEHRNVHFEINSDRDNSSQNLDPFSTNLPDFTLGARNIRSMTPNSFKNKTLPDFTLNAKTNDSDDDITYKDKISKRILDTHNGNDTSHLTRQRVQISSSPSVPLDLPSYESNESTKNLSIPFDLTVPAEEKSNNTRGMASAETVSKSLPDFLSDGPIKKQLDENLHNVRGNANLIQNGLPSPEISSVRRSDQGRLHREIEYLRRQLIEKNRRLEMLETELEHLHSTDQRETATLEYALQEVENNLKRTAKRAIHAEDMVLKLKQENKLLKSQICSLRSENVKLRVGNNEAQSKPSQEVKNKKIAKELRTAANVAENFLRSLLTGVDNLRSLAISIDSSEKYQDNEDHQEFSQEDSASGSAL